MSERELYPAGVPCWVETLQPDVEAALTFYGSVFGWEFAGPGAIPGDPPGRYFVGRLKGRDVAGVGSLPAPACQPSWATYGPVDDVDATIEKANRARGRVLDRPVDAPPAGRLSGRRDRADAAPA